MVTKEMTIREVLDLDRETAPIMLQYGMHCFGCAFATSESLEMACAAHGVSVDDLLKELNEFLDGKAKANA